VQVAADDLARNPTADRGAALIAAMREEGSVRWVPYLVDLSLIDGVRSTVAALEALTGEARPPDAAEVHRFYSSWLYARHIDAGPEYVAWKAAMYGLIDPSFTGLIAQVHDPVVAAELQWGGVRRGGIPELNAPASIGAGEAGEYMRTDELTFGVFIGDEARAYPHRILDHHELANDTLGGAPIALANCTLCRTGVVYSRVVDGETLDFQTSGLLRNSNKVMVDVQTGSLWNQLTGEAFAGPLRGTVLERFPVTVTRYGDWVAEHPDTSVVGIPGGGEYSYQPGDAYARYYASDDLWFAAREVPDAFSRKDLVATVDFGDAQLAVGVEALAGAGPRVLRVGGHRVVATPTSGGARFYDAGSLSVSNEELQALIGDAEAGEASLTGGGVSLPRVQSGHSFWFAWFGNFPETSWWPE
jgi:hypothetical protein